MIELPSHGESMTWQDYEWSVLEKMRLAFASKAIRVHGTIDGEKCRVVGMLSKVPRQLDAAAFYPGEVRPFLICDAKKRERGPDVPAVEQFIGTMEDIGPDVAGFILSAKAASPGALRRARAAGVNLQVLSQEEALLFSWRGLAHSLYPADPVFGEELARALLATWRGEPAREVVELLDNVAYEEWLAFVDYLMAKKEGSARAFLTAVAENHPDSGWRFNAIQKLATAGWLTATTRQALLEHDPDPEIRALLREGDV